MLVNHRAVLISGLGSLFCVYVETSNNNRTNIDGSVDSIILGSVIHQYVQLFFSLHPDQPFRCHRQCFLRVFVYETFAGAKEWQIDVQARSHVASIIAFDRDICAIITSRTQTAEISTEIPRRNCTCYECFGEWWMREILSSNIFAFVAGSREAAFTYAIANAGIVHALAQACSRGNISICGCSQVQRQQSQTYQDQVSWLTWEWSWNGFVSYVNDLWTFKCLA